MGSVKEVFPFIAAVAGAITGILALVKTYLELKKLLAEKSAEKEAAPTPPTESQGTPTTAAPAPKPLPAPTPPPPQHRHWCCPPRNRLRRCQFPQQKALPKITPNRQKTLLFRLSVSL